MINIVYITLIICFLVDIIKIQDVLIRQLFSKTFKKLKKYKKLSWFINHILDCSLCQAWWANIIYLYFNGLILKPVYILAALTLATFTEIISITIRIIIDKIGILLNKLNSI